MKLTEDRFAQMEAWDSSKRWVKKYFDVERNRNVYEIEHWSKRYDHRHHAIDALVVALTEQSHIQRLNNLNKELQNWLEKNKDEIKLEVKDGESIIEAFFNLEEKRRISIQESIESFRQFDKPFTDLIDQAEQNLKTMVVSHKPKDNLSIQFNEKTGKRELKIRSALHEETFYGKNNGQDTKTIAISNLSASDIKKVIDPVLRNEIDLHRKKYNSMRESFTGEGLKAFNESRFQRKNDVKLKPPVYKLKIYYNTKEVKESSLQRLYDNNNKLSVKTGGNYLFLIMEKDKKNKIGEIEKFRIFDIVSLFDAAQIANDEWKIKNENFKMKIYCDYLIKHKEKPNRVLCSLQQNDLVYYPENIEDPVLKISSRDEFQEWIDINENKTKFCKRIYKVVKFTGKDCFFIPHNYANSISVAKDISDEEKSKLKLEFIDKKIPKQKLNFEEFGSFGNSTKSEPNKAFVLALTQNETGERISKIQDSCIKLNIDWLGNVFPETFKH